MEMKMMNGQQETPSVFGAAFQNEWVKQSKRRKLWVFAAITALVPVALAVLQRVLLPGQGVLTREDLMTSALRLLSPLVLPLMVAALSIDAFTDEMAKGSIRSTLFLPAGRAFTFWAKFMSLLAGSAVLIATMWGTTLLSGLFLPQRHALLLWASADLATGFAALVPVTLIIAAVLALSQWLKSAGGILVTLVLGSIALNALPFVVEGVDNILPTTWLGFGASAQTMNPTGLVLALAVLAAWTTLFSMVGWIRFEKRAF
jgi:ABC-type transport system involved in multi-copper enzyme maturation permease subunit